MIQIASTIQSDSWSSPQVHPVDSPTKNVDGIRLHGGGYGATVTTSSGTSGGTAGSVSLSSPESAYSTGYSTDGTSPGTSFPPEYYINIRTGTHYFQNSGGSGGTTTINNNNNNNNKTRAKRPPGNAGDLPPIGSVPPGNGRVEDRGQSSASTTNMTRDNGQSEVRMSTPHKVSVLFMSSGMWKWWWLMMCSFSPKGTRKLKPCKFGYDTFLSYLFIK